MTAPDRAWLEAHAHLSNRDAAAAWGCSEITIRRMYQRAGIAHGIQKYKRYNDCGSCKARPLCRLLEPRGERLPCEVMDEWECMDRREATG
jgi:hypothetical protein